MLDKLQNMRERDIKESGPHACLSDIIHAMKTLAQIKFSRQ